LKLVVHFGPGEVRHRLWLFRKTFSRSRPTTLSTMMPRPRPGL